MAIFLHHNTWKGSASAEGFKEQIKLKAVRWSTYRYLEQVDGTNDKRLTSGGINVNGLICTKVYDKSGHALLHHIWRKEKAEDVTITHTTGSSNESGVTIREYTLKDSLIASYDCVEDESSDPIETFTLNFTKIEVKDFGQEEDGEKGQTKQTEYDLTKTK